MHCKQICPSQHGFIWIMVLFLRPLILDPVNPTFNVCENSNAWDEVAHVVQRSLLKPLFNGMKAKKPWLFTNNWWYQACPFTCKDCGQPTLGKTCCEDKNKKERPTIRYVPAVCSAAQWLLCKAPEERDGLNWGGKQGKGNVFRHGCLFYPWQYSLPHNYLNLCGFRLVLAK